jgi:hypothetical protein
VRTSNNYCRSEDTSGIRHGAEVRSHLRLERFTLDVANPLSYNDTIRRAALEIFLGNELGLQQTPVDETHSAGNRDRSLKKLDGGRCHSPCRDWLGEHHQHPAVEWNIDHSLRRIRAHDSWRPALRDDFPIPGGGAANNRHSDFQLIARFRANPNWVEASVNDGDQWRLSSTSGNIPNSDAAHISKTSSR